MTLGIRVFAAFVLLFSASAATRAADTGTLSGAVFGQTGDRIADATVEISGSALPIGRDTQTDANGVYRFEYLLPGEYTVEVTAPGSPPVRRTAVVAVGKDTQVDVLIGVALSESVTVTAVTPVVDVRSSDAGLTVTDNHFNALPLEHSYRGLFQLSPGVPDNRSAVGLSAGGSRQDNTYLLDGANITSPGFGTLAIQVNQLDIAEVNLTRAGVTAEFGRTAGTVANAVSRSGSNRFTGVARVDWLSEALVSAYRLPADLDDAGLQPGAFRDPLLTTQAEPAGGGGGPLIRDLVFFYGSARYQRDTKWGRINKVNVPLPDEVRRGPEYFGKLTASPSSRHQLTFSHRDHPLDADFNGLTSDYAPSAATVGNRSSRVTALDWAWFQGPRRSLNVRYQRTREINEDLPVTILPELPPFDPSRLTAMGQYTDPAQANLITGGREFTNAQNYRRHEARATVAQYFTTGPTSHGLKAGIGYEFAEEELDRVTNGWGAITAVTVSGVPALRARYYAQQPSQFGQGDTVSLFVQDSLTISNRLSVTAGVLLTRDSFRQRVQNSGGCLPTIPLKGGAAVYESDGDTCTFLRFGFGDEIQPRVGVS
ncbi:MAG TPA: carboxypeptidase regulatory-like domain-containing protein, partial [Vicinamibacterales bacterium]|nr:carboxypeptidase regulatory-like domain-containing protein [Vicinamibacterales bacterium]